jgi:uncharacterized protein (TIGR02246 family)
MTETKTRIEKATNTTSKATWNWRCAGFALCAFAVAGCPGEPREVETQEPDAGKPVELRGAAGDVQDVVAKYFDAYNDHSFANADEFTTDDWNFIDPWGKWIDGRDDVIEKEDAAHAGYLKKTDAMLEQVSINFASSEVAVVTAISRVTPYKAPDGVEHGTEDQCSTFVVVKREDRWLVMQTQHTIMYGLPVFDPNSAGDIPADTSGDTESEEKRKEQIDQALTWFTSLPKSHAFDAAPEFATQDLNAVTPVGNWSRTRAETMSVLRMAFTTFLDGVSFTRKHTTVRFATDDVAVVTVTNAIGSFTDTNGIKHTGESNQNTYVVVNRGGDWRLMHWQATPR